MYNNQSLNTENVEVLNLSCHFECALLIAKYA